MKLASRTHRLAPSPTLRIAAHAKAMAAQGIDVIDFAAGEPDFDTPDFVKAAAADAMHSGFTKYTAVSGSDELKAMVIEKLNAELGLPYEKSNILVSCGAKHTLYNLAEALLESGDEVVVLAPYWVSYPEQIRLADAHPVFLDTQESQNFETIDADALNASISARTKAIIVNSPCNPTGATYGKSLLETIAETALRRDLLVISDEIYEKLVYDGARHLSIASLGQDIAARTVIVNGVSKAYAMTGWRIGYAAGPRELISAMANIQSQSTSNPCSVSQKAAVAALRDGESFTRRMVDAFDQRRRVMVEHLNKMPGVRCPVPTGAFYAFPNIAGVLGKHHAGGRVMTPADLAEYLLAEARVSVVPGEPFGSDAHIRLSYAAELSTIERGLERMEAAIKKLA